MLNPSSVLKHPEGGKFRNEDQKQLFIQKCGYVSVLREDPVSYPIV